MALDEDIRSCTACPLHQTRTRAVPGVGAVDARVLFVGEAPGQTEDRRGIPFCGPAGNLLDELLQSINLKRTDVFIANVVCCRPPNNRPPTPAEKATCRPFLERRIDLISPRVIVPLGNHAKGAFDILEPISRAKARPWDWNGITVFPLYHPAAALHNPSLKQELFDDFQRLGQLLGTV